ncbi:MAG: autotransporter-associated beta strand repeat-containing protein [Pirellulales bacterium]|nr:autotransporter-associated beta strand repeat-containing protein [Pirellulales bacterium]
MSIVLLTATVAVFLGVSTATADSFSWQDWQTTVKGGDDEPDVWGGQCWAFASCGLLESKYMLTRNDHSAASQINLSEQQLVWNAYYNGYSFDAAIYYAASHGMVSQAECPPDPANLFLPTGSEWPIQSTDVWKSGGPLFGLGTSTEAVKDALKKYGPLFQRCNAMNDFYGAGAGGEVGAHAVVLVGYQDDASVAGGGYWIVKNNWGADYGYSGYNYIPYATQPESIWDTEGVAGPVYYTTAMASATWSGGSGTWAAGNSTKWSGYAWENKETTATFGGTGGTVTVSGSVIAHGMTINSANYSFTGGSLTVTAGGIAANESTTIGSPLYIGGPQSWTVASGKTLTFNGALHTVISDMTVAGAGNVVINGLIDGGGAANGPNDSYAKPGGIIKNNTGSLTFNAASTYGGDITINTGTLTLAAGGTYSGAFYGSGGISCGNDATSIGGRASSFYGTIALPSTATFSFVPTDGIRAVFFGTVSGGGPIVQNGAGTTVLAGNNTYTNTTTILQGALEANDGFGLPTNSFLSLNGGVLQCNYYSFTRALGTGGNAFQWDVNGGGFAAYSNPVTVNIGNDSRTLTWGTSVGSQIVGTLKFSSPSATATVTFQNPINLNGGDRTISVDDNPVADDYAYLPSVITGSGSLIKSGPGLLLLSGSNGYSGTTVISDGALQATIGTGIPGSGFISLDGGVYQANMISGTENFTRSLGTSGGTFEWTANGGGFSARGGTLNVNVGGASDTLTWGAQIQGLLKFNSTYAAGVVDFQNPLDLNGGARTVFVNDDINRSTDYAVLSNAITDSVGGGSLTKTGPGVLYLKGSTSNNYTGGTTINGGIVYLQKTGGATAIPGDVTMNFSPYNANLSERGNSTWLILKGTNQISSSAVITFNGNYSSQWAGLELNGNNLTLGGINAAHRGGLIEATYNEGGAGNCTLTLDTAVGANYFYNGLIVNNSGGSGVLSLVKTGPGTQALAGMGFAYTGGTTINGGTLQIGDGLYVSELPSDSILVNSGGTLNFFNQNPAGTHPGGYFFQHGSITGTGTVMVTLSNQGFNVGTGYNTTLSSFSGTTSIQNAAAYVRSADGLGVGSVNVGAGSTYSMWTGTTTTFITPITLNGIGGTNDGYAKPAIYGDGGSGTFTISGQISLAATSDIGNYTGNGTLTLSGKITGPGGLVLGKLAPTMADENGVITLSGATGNDYTGGTTINRGTVYLAKTGGAVAIPGNVTLSTATVAATGNTYLVLNGSNQIASSAVMTFTPAASAKSTFELYGNTQTLRGLADATGRGYVENTESQTGIGNGSLTINTVNSTDNFSFNGYLRNTASGSGILNLVKTGPGVQILTGSHITFSGTTTISGGALQANHAAGLPTGSFLSLDGGVLQSNGYSTVNFTRSLGTGGGTFQFTANGGGFSAGTAPLNVYLNSSTNTVAWGTSGNVIKGTLKFGSPTAANVTTFQNPINLGTSTRTVQVDENPSSTQDRAVLARIVSGAGGLTKTGAGRLTLSALNSYGGDTTVLDGILEMTGGIDPNGTSLIDVQSGIAKLMTTNVNKADLNVSTSAAGMIEIVNGSHLLGIISGEGITQVDGGASLTVASITQGTLIIGGAKSADAAPVPEPSGWMLLASGLLFLLAVQGRIWKRSSSFRRCLRPN